MAPRSIQSILNSNSSLDSCEISPPEKDDLRCFEEKEEIDTSGGSLSLVTKTGVMVISLFVWNELSLNTKNYKLFLNDFESFKLYIGISVLSLTIVLVCHMNSFPQKKF